MVEPFLDIFFYHPAEIENQLVTFAGVWDGLNQYCHKMWEVHMRKYNVNMDAFLFNILSKETWPIYSNWNPFWNTPDAFNYSCLADVTRNVSAISYTMSDILSL